MGRPERPRVACGLTNFARGEAAMAKITFILALATIFGCVPERITLTPPIAVLSAQAARDSEYVAMCEHRPGVRIRLYGCTPSNRGQPLFVVDGEMLPVDTIGAGKLRRERAIAALDPSKIESIQVFKRDDAGMLAKYGNAARNGVLVITLSTQDTKPPSKLPDTR